MKPLLLLGPLALSGLALVAGAGEAPDALVRALRDRYADRRDAAATALIALGPAAAPAVPALARLFTEADDWQTHRCAAKVLIALGPTAAGGAPDLVEALRRAQSARDLASFRLLVDVLDHMGPAGEAAIAPALVGALTDGVEPVMFRFAADRAPRLAGEPRQAAIRQLAAALSSEQPEFPPVAANALAQFGSDAEPALGAFRAALATAVDKKDPWRLKDLSLAVRQIGEAGHRLANSVMMDVLALRDFGLLGVAVNQVTNLPPADATLAVERLAAIVKVPRRPERDLWDRAYSGLFALGVAGRATAAAAIATGIAEGDASVVEHVLAVFARSPSSASNLGARRRIAAALIAAAQNGTDLETRKAAMEAIPAFAADASGAGPALERLATDPSVQAAAKAALSRMPRRQSPSPPSLTEDLDRP
jgi:hypothetical protein